MSNILFLIFFIILVFSALLVVIAKHPIYSILALITSFFAAVFLLFLLECEFLGLLFVLIYVGAISILFLFCVMMLESKFNNLANNQLKYFSVSLIFLFLVLLILSEEITLIFQINFNEIFFFLNLYQNWFNSIDAFSDIKVFGQVLYSYYVVQFLLAGLILLLILLGVVYLTNFFATKVSLNQLKFKQLSRNSNFFL